MEGRSFWKICRRMRVPKSERRPMEMKISMTLFSVSSEFGVVVSSEVEAVVVSEVVVEEEDRRKGRLLSEM
jgi:hypothetical protein